MRSLDEAIAYLGEPGELTDPALMPNLEIAVERLGRACADAETVAILGDFDVDGLTSTTILSEGLRELGARPLPYIPDRFSEGYGPNPQAVRLLHAQGASVLVTADCGTSALREVELANELGMDVIVIDHHTVPDELPDAFALVNPKLGGSQYGSEPAAVGVAHKVVDQPVRAGRPWRIARGAPRARRPRDDLRPRADAGREPRPGAHRAARACALAAARLARAGGGGEGRPRRG